MLMQYNISPETLVKDPSLYDEKDLIKTPVARKKGFTDSDGKTKRFEPIYYDKTKKGIIPAVVEQIFNDRIRFKKLLKKAKKERNKADIDYYDRMQYIRKIMINSVYGVLGNPYFHFYNVKNAMAVMLIMFHLLNWD